MLTATVKSVLGSQLFRFPRDKHMLTPYRIVNSNKKYFRRAFIRTIMLFHPCYSTLEKQSLVISVTSNFTDTFFSCDWLASCWKLKNSTGWTFWLYGSDVWKARWDSFFCWYRWIRKNVFLLIFCSKRYHAYRKIGWYYVRKLKIFKIRWWICKRNGQWRKRLACKSWLEVCL